AQAMGCARPRAQQRPPHNQPDTSPRFHIAAPEKGDLAGGCKKWCKRCLKAACGSGLKAKASQGRFGQKRYKFALLICLRSLHWRDVPVRQSLTLQHVREGSDLHPDHRLWEALFNGFAAIAGTRIMMKLLASST